MTSIILTHRFEEALLFMLNLHKYQQRKGTQIPYIAHLMSVSALVLEDGGDEDLAIAGLLHDAVEDQGGLEILEQIKENFGERVTKIVSGCTDTFLTPKPPWLERKINYIDNLLTADHDIVRVSLADKLHNARCIKRDYQNHGDEIWIKFNGGKEGTLWYYQELVRVYKATEIESLMLGELERLVIDIINLSCI